MRQRGKQNNFLRKNEVINKTNLTITKLISNKFAKSKYKNY